MLKNSSGQGLVEAIIIIPVFFVFFGLIFRPFLNESSLGNKIVSMKIKSTSKDGLYKQFFTPNYLVTNAKWTNPPFQPITNVSKSYACFASINTTEYCKPKPLGNNNVNLLQTDLHISFLEQLAICAVEFCVKAKNPTVCATGIIAELNMANSRQNPQLLCPKASKYFTNKFKIVSCSIDKILKLNALSSLKSAY